MHTFKLSTLLILFGIVSVLGAKRSKIITLTSENWDQTLKGEWMIKFFAPWCPACKAMEEDYKKFADWSDDLNIRIAEVNMNKEPGLSGRFIVTALPTIYHAKDGEFRRYTGARDTNSLHRFVETQLWQGVDPVGWYRHPQSFPMMLMSGLFQTSVVMKNFHEVLTETYGFSTNMAYVIFAVATIVAGLVLGLILVFIIDCISPPKRQGKREPEVEMSSPLEESKEPDESEEEVADEKESVGTASSAEASEEEKSQKGESSEDEANEERRSSQSSSRTSQDWEQVQGEEIQESQLNIEKQLPDEPEEGQGELRKRVTQKKEEEAEDEA